MLGFMCDRPARRLRQPISIRLFQSSKADKPRGGAAAAVVSCRLKQDRLPEATRRAIAHEGQALCLFTLCSNTHRDHPGWLPMAPGFMFRIWSSNRRERTRVARVRRRSTRIPPRQHSGAGGERKKCRTWAPICWIRRMSWTADAICAARVVFEFFSYRAAGRAVQKIMADIWRWAVDPVRRAQFATLFCRNSTDPKLRGG